MNEEKKYQRIYEDEVSDNLKDSLEMPDRYYDLSHQQRMFITELVDIGNRTAVEENLDTSVLEETAALAAEMGTQLYNFANMLATYLNTDDEKEQE